ncbi:AfsR/SARP family transcriptional regulator [Streptomyces geranii]|uniref:AfsR/SARP family transcriptional regulator n=1 Tax=Streptomyces geranii TaxID=2058923 RepID=UPI001E51F5A4|nr:BTAD domain-containing putative transcriptional regulator [Streptomyces geranii]
MEERLRFSLLGPVRAWRGEDEIELGPPQQRALLAVLLLAEGAQVPAGGLVDAVWGTRVPASALGILRTYVHRLRQALEPAGDTASSMIRSTGDGYQLRTSAAELDLRTFRELLGRGERARRDRDLKGSAARLRDALALWQGTALAGVRGEYAQTQRQRLDELRLSAEAARLTAELGLGAHTETAAELTGLVAEHPLDERFRELLMLALYRSGRQAAALDTYREAQSLLADELGVDPGPALQSLYQRVLRADTGLLSPSPDLAPPEHALRAAPVPVPAQLPADLPVFVGREAELAEVARLPFGGAVVISAIAGTAGVGKTTFAVHWARGAADGFPDGQLYLNLRGFDPVGQPVPPEHALRTLLESLGADPRGLPQGVDALAARYRTLLTGKRVLVLLDNARDAAQVRPLLPGEPGCLVVVTSRNRLAGLVAVDGAHPLHLDVLSVAESRALLARRLGPARIAAEPDAVDEIIARCARLPLALAVTAARVATRSVIPLAVIAAELRENAGGLDAFHDSDTAADVPAVFSWSYHALTPDAARLFRLLALHPGPDTSLPAAASLAGLPRPHTRRLLSELVQAHLVDETTPGRYASHDLLRAYATELSESEDPPEQVRAARQRILDHYLHTAHAAVALTDRARALISLPRPAEGVRAEEFGEDAGQAAAWFTAEQAVLLATVEQAAGRRYDVHTWQLAWALAKQLHLQGMWREEEAVHRTAMDAALRLDDRTALAYAHLGLGTATTGLGRFDEARVHVERAVELHAGSGDTRACAESCRVLTWVAEQQGDPHAALGAAQRSLALLRAHDGPGADDRRLRTATASALNSVGWCHVLLGQHREGLDHCEQALALHEQLGDDIHAAHTWDSIGHAHHHLGQYDEAVTGFGNALARYRRHDGMHWFVSGTLMRLGDTHLSAGRPDAARAAWAEGLDILERLAHVDAEQLRTRLRRLDDPT